MARTNLHNFLTDDDWSMLVMKVLKMDKMMRLKMITTRMLRMKSKTQPRREEKDPPDPAAEVSLLLLIQYLPYMAPSYQHRQAVLYHPALKALRQPVGLKASRLTEPVVTSIKSYGFKAGFYQSASLLLSP